MTSRENSGQDNPAVQKLPWKWRTATAQLPGLRPTIATNISVTLLGTLTGVIIARLLGPSGRGELAAMQLWAWLLGNVAVLGLDNATIFWSKRHPEDTPELLGSSLVLCAMAMPVVLLAGWWVLPFALQAQPPEVVWYARLLLLYVPAYAFFLIPQHLLRALGAWRSWNALRVLPTAIWAAAVTALAVFRGHATSGELAVVFLATLLPPLAAVYVMIRRLLARAVGVRRSFFTPLLGYGLPDVGTLFTRVANLRLDQLILAGLVGSESLGFYAAAVAWSGISTPILGAIGPALFPQLSGTLDPRERRRRLKHAVLAAAGTASAIAVPWIILTPWLFPLLFGNAFQPATTVAQVLALASAVNGVNGVLQDGLRGLGYPQVSLWSEGVGALATAAGLWLLLPRFGIQGAAVASLLSYLATGAVLGVGARWAVGLGRGTARDHIMRSAE